MQTKPKGEGMDNSEEIVLIPLDLPKSLHAKLTRQADVEGVSMNTLAVALLAEGLGRKQAGR